jgi:hypothetical protein
MAIGFIITTQGTQFIVLDAVHADPTSNIHTIMEDLMDYLPIVPLFLILEMIVKIPSKTLLLSTQPYTNSS